MKSVMKSRATKQLASLCILLTLSGCATTDKTPDAPQTAVDTIDSVEQQIKDLLQTISKSSQRKHNFSRISHCRYEISTLWSSLDQGYYGALNRQRFSFTHDIRDISHTPKYVLKFEDGLQHWQEMIELSFNRAVPSSFRHVNTTDYQSRVRRSTSDGFSISGYHSVPDTVMTQLLGSLRTMTRLCANDISKVNQIEHKVIGRWDLYGLSASHGSLVIDGKTATLKHEDKGPVSGPYAIENKGSHYLLTINPNDPTSRYALMLDFITSNYARLLLLGDKQGPQPFARLTGNNEDDVNPDELKLFRLGDLR